MIFKTRHFTLEVNSKGIVTSLKLTSGKELLAEQRPLLSISLEGGKMLDGTMRASKGSLSFGFGKHGTIAMRVEEMPDYIRFTLESIDLQDYEELLPLCIAPKCVKYRGDMGGMLSDDEDMVCIRSLSLMGSVRITKEGTPSLQPFAEAYLQNNDDRRPAFALAAAPREKMLRILKNVTNNEPVPKSLCGGAWSMEAISNRGSYLWLEFEMQDLEDWIKFARRGGFQYVHLHGWWKTLGHYDVKKDYYPNGLDDMKKAVDRFHQAGLKVTFHTLTACIQPDDTWISPVPSDDLIATYTYTLSKPLSKTGDRVYVDELPKPGHEVVMSYSSSGNVLKIGKELIQYSEISHEKPYYFGHCVRGAFGTKVSSHNAGDKVDYLRQRYIAFYPKPDSPLGEALSSSIADKINYLGLQGLYYDGSEGMGLRYDVDAMRWKIFQKVDHDILTEGSCWPHNAWWFHSRIGAYDYPVWGPKKQHASHTRLCASFRKCNLLMPQMGWWAALGSTAVFPGQFMDEMEYFACKNLAVDGPMSLLETSAKNGQWNGRIFDMMTVIGWYERMRLANYFTVADLRKIANLDKEFTLRMDDQGVWKLRELNVHKAKFEDIGGKGAEWNITIDNPSLLRARIETLYAARPVQGEKFLEFCKGYKSDVSEAAEGVSVKTKVYPATKTESGRIHIQADNSNSFSDGAWLREGRVYDYPFRSFKVCDGFGLWVKGDNSGALLNIQVCSPKPFGRFQSDHYIRLDFSGWKYFIRLLRERDTDKMADHKWPYNTDAGYSRNCRGPLSTKGIGEINIFVNDIPAKGSLDIEIKDIECLAQERCAIEGLRLQVNDAEIKCPCQVTAGDYLEYTDAGELEVYSQEGRLYRRFSAKECCKGLLPSLKSGANRLSLSGNVNESGLTARAELTLFTDGKSFGTCSRKTDWSMLKEEYEMPITLLALDKQGAQWNIFRRDSQGASPNDIPTLDIEIEAVSAGIANASDAKSDIIDDFASPDSYLPSKKNPFAQCLNTLGTDRNEDTELQLEKFCSEGRTGMFVNALSKRKGDNIGWISFGRTFAKPVDLSKCEGIGLWIGCKPSMSSLKIRLCDVHGNTHDCTVQLNDASWRLVDFYLGDATGIDLSKISCIAYSVNHLMCGNRPAQFYLGGLVKLAQCPYLDTPTFKIRRNVFSFPCKIRSGYVLHFGDEKEWQLSDYNGNVVQSGKVKGVVPKLKAGKNPVKLTFKKARKDSIRVDVNIIKKY